VPTDRTRRENRKNRENGEASKEVSEETSKEASEETSKKTSKKTPKEASEETSKETEISKETPTETSKETPTETSKDTPKETSTEISTLNGEGKHPRLRSAPTTSHLIVNVLPLPVCPYANAVAAYPFNAESNNLRIPQPSKNCFCVVVGPLTMSGQNKNKNNNKL